MKDLILKSLIVYDKAQESFLFEYKFKLILDIFNNKWDGMKCYIF